MKCTLSVPSLAVDTNVQLPLEKSTLSSDDYDSISNIVSRLDVNLDPTVFWNIDTAV